MKKFGIKYVRGGKYSSEVLELDTINYIVSIIWIIRKKCFRCGNNKHNYEECNQVFDIYNNPIEIPKYKLFPLNSINYIYSE